MIGRLKISYMIYNFFQRKKLVHNILVYKKLGLKKFYFSPVSSKDFKNIDTTVLNDKRHAADLTNTAIYKEASEQTKQSILNFEKEGFLILNNYLSGTEVDTINTTIDDLLKTKKVKFRYGNKIMFAIHQSSLLTAVGNNEKLLNLLSSLIGGELKLFQSINFLMGSEQHTHSDSIHMTTYPLGGLLGVWIALEDIELDNGPLHYYPGSHKLPYYLNSDYDNEGSYFLLGNKDYTAYERMLEQKIASHAIDKKVFTAKKGDLLVWHANLMHGGEPHLNKNKTRKSMVFHYYNINSVCYHEITQRPSLIYK
jgi:phytanoyl-CoA hydroxylase